MRYNVKLVRHRLYDVSDGLVAVLSENSSGWCIVSRISYLKLKDFFSQTSKKYHSDISNPVIDKLWKADLLEIDGQTLGQCYENHTFPGLFLVKMTGACNFQCTYCYDYSKSRATKKLDVVKALDTIFFLLEKRSTLSILFHGGEPLLEFPTIRYIVQEVLNSPNIHDKKIAFSLQTNGSLLTKEIIYFLEKHNFSVGLSLNGFTELANHGRVTTNSKSCLEYILSLMEKYPQFVKKNCGFVSVVDKNNIAHIPEFALWLQDKGFSNLSTYFLHYGGKASKLKQDIVTAEEAIGLYNQIIDMIKSKKIEALVFDNIYKYIENFLSISSKSLCYKQQCGAAAEYLVLDVEGNYRACDCTYTHYLLLEGNKHTDIFNNPTRHKINCRIERMKKVECGKCAFFGFCGGTCVALSLLTNGSEYIPYEINCKLNQFIYPQLLQEFALDQEQPLFNYYYTSRNKHSK